MAKPKKSQKPAYVVKSSPKSELEDTGEERPQSQVKSLMGSPPYQGVNPSKLGQFSVKKTEHGSFGRHPAQDRPMRMKTSSGPAKSLMSIDFSGMGVNSAGKSSITRTSSHSQRFSGHSADEESRPDRRSDRRHQGHRESSRGGDRASMWRDRQHQSHHSHRAPLIIDMGLPKSSGDMYSPNQPKSLLGDYWTSIASRPASLMDITARDSMEHYSVQQETFSRREQFPSSLIPQRSLAGNRREDPSSRKRPHRSGDIAGEVQNKKMFKVEQSQKSIQEPSSRLRVCKRKSQMFVLIPALCSTPYLHGRAKVTVVKGSVSVLTHQLRPGTQYDVFSPSSGSLLALTCADSPKIKAEEVRAELAKFGIPENDKDMENIGDDTVAVVMLSRLKSAVCDYITSFIPYTQLFTAPQPREKDLHTLRGVTLSNLGIKLAPLKEMGPMCLNMSQDYNDVLGRFTTQICKSTTSKKASPIWLCCGAKNAGKSTFCRMLINTALKSVKTVGYLECDVGQTEFSPPATLSFHLINKPILGQPFCHQRQAERLVFYGETAAGHNPSVYIKCLKHVLSAYTDMEEKPPLIVNTMGFPEGIGRMLLIDTVRLTQPDMVVQIESYNQAANLPAITHELVALEEGWTFNKTPVGNILPSLP